MASYSYQTVQMAETDSIARGVPPRASQTRHAREDHLEDNTHDLEAEQLLEHLIPSPQFHAVRFSISIAESLSSGTGLS